MRWVGAFSFLLLSSIGASQDLFQDFTRGVVFTGPSADLKVSVPLVSPSPFEVGFVEFTSGVLLRHSLAAPTISGFPLDQNPNVIGTTPSEYSSGIYWNFGSSVHTLPNGRILPATAVTLQNEGLIPAVEIVCPKSPDPVTVVMTATPVGGGSTPGRIYLQTYANGKWTKVYDYGLTGTKTNTRQFTFTTRTRLRFMLLQNNGSSALAQATLSVRIQ